MRTRLPLIPVQCASALLALASLVLWPPQSGKLLLIPLDGHDVNAVARVALAGGATLLGTGPVMGSLVVVGDRSRIAANVGWTVAILAAPPAGCGLVGARGTAA